MRLIFAVVFIITTMICAAGVFAADFIAGEKVTYASDNEVEGDLFIGADNVTIDEDVSGDFFCGANTVAVNRPIVSSAFIGCQSCNVNKAIGNDAFLAGNNVVVTSEIGDNAYIGANTARVMSESVVKTDLFVGANTIEVLGTIGRDATIYATHASFAGNVGRDLFIQSNSLNIADGARVEGNFTYVGPEEPTIPPGVVGGEFVYKKMEKDDTPTIDFAGFGIAFWIISFVATAIFGCVTLAILPVRSVAVANIVRQSFWASLGIGLLSLGAIPIAAIILLITVVGIWLGVSVFLVYPVILSAAAIFTSLALGMWILGRGKSTIPNKYLAMLLGLFIFALLGAIPYAGWLVKLVVVMVGLGALLINIGRGLNPPTAPSPGVMPPPDKGPSVESPAGEASDTQENRPDS